MLLLLYIMQIRTDPTRRCELQITQIIQIIQIRGISIYLSIYIYIYICPEGARSSSGDAMIYLSDLSDLSDLSELPDLLRRVELTDSAPFRRQNYLVVESERIGSDSTREERAVLSSR